MTPLKKKIEELKEEIEAVNILLDKNAEKVVHNRDLFTEEDKIKWREYLSGGNSMKVLKAKLQAYEEAQKLMDETLKNIIDEIDELTKNEVGTIGYFKNINASKVKQIIQKHFNSQVTKFKQSDEIGFKQNTPDTSLLDKFCEELKEELGYNRFPKELESEEFDEIINKLKKKHGAKA